MVLGSVRCDPATAFTLLCAPADVDRRRRFQANGFVA
jgi:hypothetical protein